MRRASSRITHADSRCTAGCAILNCTLAALARDEDEALDQALAYVDDTPDELAEALEGVPENVAPSELENSGYVVHTLQTSLYHGLSAPSAEEAIVAAVNMGGDTDTLGAVTGAIAGARFGVEALPQRWRDPLTVAEELQQLAEELVSL